MSALHPKPTDPTDSLYERDFFLWTQEQAEALRKMSAEGNNMPLDWENLAEEIESLGRSERRELASRIATLIQHLLKLEHSPASEPRAGWLVTVRRERREIERLLKDSPSLRREVPVLVKEEWRGALEDVADELRVEGEPNAEIAAALASGTNLYSVDQVLGRWFPGEESSTDSIPSPSGLRHSRLLRRDSA